jgi:hypothetical protein
MDRQFFFFSWAVKGFNLHLDISKTGMWIWKINMRNETCAFFSKTLLVVCLQEIERGSLPRKSTYIIIKQDVGCLVEASSVNWNLKKVI